MDRLQCSNRSQCKVPADLANVSAVAKLLKEYCQLRLLDPIEWASLELGFCEALNNAIKHGCQNDPTKTVFVEWTWSDENLAIEIEDPGCFNPGNHRASLPENQLNESGRGLYLIDTVFDRVEHASSEHGHKICLSKSLSPPRNALTKMQELYESLQNLSSELNQSYAELSALQGFADDICSTSTLDGALSRSLERLRSIFELPRADIWLLRGNRLVKAFSEETDSISLVEHASLPITRAYRDQREQIVVDCQALDPKDPLFSPNRCALIAPISCQGDHLGATAIQLPVDRIGEIETTIARSIRIFNQLLALSIAKTDSERHRKEIERSKAQLEIASEIQRSLLPSEFPQSHHCRITGRCIAAQAVGGDYIDSIEIKGHGLLLIIADVMGKGVPAALLATIFRTAIRSRLNLAETPGWLLSQINEQFHSELGHLNMFITAQAAYFCYRDKSLKLASAGHCPAFLSRATEHLPEQLNAEGLPLGIQADYIYEERLFKLSQGERLVFITDGIYEAENQAGEMLGLSGFAQQFPQIWRGSFEDVPENAFAVVATHAQGGASQDDKTLLALEVL
jgi:serine phosphatase RsbU (regulator of sigma subunit)/anti-sigma regulatory factor (Ser/Thr protein kinase)